MGAFWKWLTGSMVREFTGPLLQAYEAKLSAQNDHDRIEAEKEIARLESARDIALAEANDRLSATRLGRYLIVVPYGIWWASIYLIQILNPWLMEPVFDFTLVVRDVPTSINDMAMVLVPAILLADAYALTRRSK